MQREMIPVLLERENMERERERGGEREYGEGRRERPVSFGVVTGRF